MRLPRARTTRLATTRLATTATTATTTAVTLVAATATLLAAYALPAVAAPTTPQPVPSTVAVAAPAADLVRVGDRLRVTGRVTSTLGAAAGDRVVRLALRTPAGLLPMGAPVRSAADGRFALPVPTWWTWRGTLVTQVEPAERTVPLLDDLGLEQLVEVLVEAASAALATPVTVSLGWSGRGPASAWAPLLAGFRYDPCSPLTYRVNPSGAPAGGVRAVHETFRRVAAATGLRFRHAGSTAAVPFNDVGRAQYAPGTTLTVAWATPRQVRRLAGGVVGVGGSGGFRSADGASGVYDHGGVVLDRTFRAPATFGRGVTLGSLLLHEVGHAVGLGHVRDTRQVMHPTLRRDAVGRWGAGDLAGLRRVGAGQGCATLGSSARTSARVVAGGTGGSGGVRFAPEPHVVRAR